MEKKRQFSQIIGAVLLDVESSKAMYSGLNSKDSKIYVHRFCFKLDKGDLTIENPFTMNVREEYFKSSDLDIFNKLHNLIGSRVENAWFEKEEINIIFNNAHLKISLKDEDFVSPEAGSFVSSDNSTFIVFDEEN